MNKRLVSIVRKVLENKPVVYVFCGCAKELEVWQRRNPNKTGKYITDASVLMGLHAVQIEFYGTWAERNGSSAILEQLKRIEWENAE